MLPSEISGLSLAADSSKAVGDNTNNSVSENTEAPLDPKMEDLKIANKFIEELKAATLKNSNLTMTLSTNFVMQYQNHSLTSWIYSYSFHLTSILPLKMQQNRHMIVSVR